MARPRLGRLALFAALCALLLVAALGFAGADRAGSPALALRAGGTAASRLPAAARRIERRAAHLEASLRRAARPFLAAFLRYEGGLGAPADATALRASATPGFAARLLADAPRAPASGYPSRARLRALSVTFLSARADWALVRAAAGRSGGAEQLSFLFARRSGRWLATGPGQ